MQGGWDSGPTSYPDTNGYYTNTNAQYQDAIGNYPNTTAQYPITNSHYPATTGGQCHHTNRQGKKKKEKQYGEYPVGDGQYPQPPPNLSVPIKTARYWNQAVPTSTTYSDNYGDTTVQGWDLPQLDDPSIFGFPTYQGGYMTHAPPPASGVENGLNTSWHEWNQSLADNHMRAKRAQQESMVAQYWPQSPKYGPQGTNPASSALIMLLVLSTAHANFKEMGSIHLLPTLSRILPPSGMRGSRIRRQVNATTISWECLTSILRPIRREPRTTRMGIGDKVLGLVM
jgi:hypothetical protein